MYDLIRPLLFNLPAETAHNLTLSLLKLPGATSLAASVSDDLINQEVIIDGLKFRNPLGLAAGLDKNAEVFNQMAKLGFGFVEVGTVTPKAQPGNDQPRLFRLKKDKGLINRMGFNNMGVQAMKDKLQQNKAGIPIGGNIGKNKITPNEEALNDYIYCFEELYDLVDYFTLNISSPNTPGLRELQNKEFLAALFGRLNELNIAQKPIFFKVAPDMSFEQLDELLDVALLFNLSGIIATNTTLDRSGLKCSDSELEKIGAGGLSGAPLKKHSTKIVKHIYKSTSGKLPIIACGGIMSGDDALEKLDAGASLIQIYTGFVYKGPALIAEILRKTKQRHVN